jgi:hypothetical protein
MRKAMRDEGMKALEVKKRVEEARAGRIAIVDGGQIGTEAQAKRLVVSEYAMKRLRDETGIDVRMVQALRQAMADGVFEILMAQYRCEDEAAERRLGLHGGLRLGADLRPNRVDDLNV